MRLLAFSLILRFSSIGNPLTGHGSCVVVRRLLIQMGQNLIFRVSLSRFHEQCLYHGIVAGQLLLCLQQVDGFAIACNNIKVAGGVIKTVESKITITVHSLGIITRFNGVDVQQTQYYIKLSMHKYLTKMLMNHGWSIFFHSVASTT